MRKGGGEQGKQYRKKEKFSQRLGGSKMNITPFPYKIGSDYW